MQGTTPKIRFIIVLVSFVLFPVTLFYMSPVFLFLGAKHGIINFNLLLFSGQFVLSIFFGRIFCGWICPGSGIATMCLTANKKLVNRRFFWIKYIVWIPWIVSIVIVLIHSHKQIVINPFYGMQNPVSIFNRGGLMVYFLFVGIMMLLSLVVGKHSFCHHVCWMAPFMIAGIKLGRLFRISRLELYFNHTNCNLCGACSNKCPMSINIPEAAKSNNIILDSDCTLCAECVNACNKSVISIKYLKK